MGTTFVSIYGNGTCSVSFDNFAVLTFPPRSHAHSVLESNLKTRKKSPHKKPIIGNRPVTLERSVLEWYLPDMVDHRVREPAVTTIDIVLFVHYWAGPTLASKIGEVNVCSRFMLAHLSI